MLDPAPAQPVALDLALVAVVAIAWPLWAALVSWPKVMRDVASGKPMARRKLYLGTMLEQWGLVAALAWIWRTHGRPWAALGLAAPSAWRLAVGLALWAALAWTFAKQVRRVAANPAAQERLRGKLGHLAPLLPTTPVELVLFVLLSTTAGFCEELLFRGYLPWVFAPWTTWGGGLALATVLFGCAHAYQGRKYILRTGIVGAVMALVFVATGSLVPVMLLHATIDIGSGSTVYAALRGRPVPPEPHQTPAGTGGEIRHGASSP